MNKIWWYVLWMAQYGIIIAFWLWNHIDHPNGNQLTQDRSTLLLSLGQLAGLLAVLGILVQLVLIGRVRWVERTFGLDTLSRIHHYNGIVAAGVIVTHPLLVGLGYGIQSNTTLWNQLGDFLLHWEDVLAAAIGWVLLLVVTGFSLNIIRRRLKYETWYLIHLGVYLAVILAIGHQFEIGGDFSESRGFLAYWYALYFLAAGNLIFFRIILPLWYYRQHHFAVDRLVPETNDVTSVYIRGDNLDKFPVQAGQFMIVRFMTKGFWPQAHPFSLSCLPDSSHIRMSIKNCGDFTARIPELTPGTPVLIDGPHGIFTARKCAQNKILMIAGGIGITPVRSLSEELVRTGKDVIVLYSNRTGNSIVFQNEFQNLTAGHPNFRAIYVVTDDPAWPGETGRLDRAKIEKLVPDLIEREVYLCGPPPMMAAILTALKELGVFRTRIHYEKFSL